MSPSQACLPPTPVLRNAAPRPASGAQQGRAGHPAPLPALGDRALAQRQHPLALSGRRRRDATSPPAWARWRGARSRTGRSCPRKAPADLIGIIDLWPDDGVSRDQRGFWLDPAFQGQGLMTEAADRVTEYAFRELGWPCLWLSNAAGQPRLAPRSRRSRAPGWSTSMIGRYVGGEALRRWSGCSMREAARIGRLQRGRAAIARRPSRRGVLASARRQDQRGRARRRSPSGGSRRAGAGRDQAADDDVLLEALPVVCRRRPARRPPR